MGMVQIQFVLVSLDNYCFVFFFFLFGQSGAFKMSKEGFVLLQFAPAVGLRQYDWNRKQVCCF